MKNYAIPKKNFELGNARRSDASFRNRPFFLPVPARSYASVSQDDVRSQQSQTPSNYNIIRILLRRVIPEPLIRGWSRQLASYMILHIKSQNNNEISLRLLKISEDFTKKRETNLKKGSKRPPLGTPKSSTFNLFSRPQYSYMSREAEWNYY